MVPSPLPHWYTGPYINQKHRHPNSVIHSLPLAVLLDATLLHATSMPRPIVMALLAEKAYSFLSESRLLKEKEEGYNNIFRNNQAYLERKLVDTRSSFRFGAKHTQVRRMKIQDILHQRDIMTAQYEKRKEKLYKRWASLTLYWSNYVDRFERDNPGWHVICNSSSSCVLIPIEPSN